MKRHMTSCVTRYVTGHPVFVAFSYQLSRVGYTFRVKRRLYLTECGLRVLRCSIKSAFKTSGCALTLKTAEKRTIIQQIRWSLHRTFMGGLLHLVQRGGPRRAVAPPSPLLAVPDVTTHPSTASVPISDYSMWHYNCLRPTFVLRAKLQIQATEIALCRRSRNIKELSTFSLSLLVILHDKAVDATYYHPFASWKLLKYLIRWPSSMIEEHITVKEQLL